MIQSTIDGKIKAEEENLDLNNEPIEDKKLNFHSENQQTINQIQTILSRSVWIEIGSQRGIKKEHGPTFSQSLANKIIWLYSHKNDTIFDPFVGTGTTLQASLCLERNCIGIELNKTFYRNYLTPIIKMNEFNSKYKISCYNDDCRNLLNYIKPETIKLTLTSPPYANFIQKSIQDRGNRKELYGNFNTSTIKQYSKSELDFGNLNYRDYLKEIEIIFEKIYIITKQNGFFAIIIKDYRDIQNGIQYIPFHIDFSIIAEKKGFLLREITPIDQNLRRKLLINGSKNKPYMNLGNHSYLLVFYKETDKEKQKRIDKTINN